MKKLLSIFAFERPVDYDYISKSFCQTHQRRQKIREAWPVRATRRMLISNYWSNAIIHYLLIFGISVFITAFFNSQLNAFYFSGSVLAGIIISSPLFLILYLPMFNYQFLPNLETTIETYTNEERAWMEKCKQAQLSNRAIVLFFYVLDKTSGINCLARDKKALDLFTRIFGASPDGIKKALDLLYDKEKRAKLGNRPAVEVRKSFDEVYAVLEIMQFSAGTKLLKELEQKFLRP